MPWYVWVFILYIVLDRLANIYFIGRSIEITPGFTVLSFVTGALMIWMAVSLAS